MAESLVSTYGLPVYVTDDGIMSLTVMSIVVVALPPLLVAVTVYVVKAELTVGVPLISPVDASISRPVGSEGAIDHVTTGPPLTLGMPVVIAVSLVSTKALEL